MFSCEPKFKLGITIDRWGPAAWNTLHSFAHCSPERLSQVEQDEWKEFMYSFARRLPCPRCRRHLKKYLDEHIRSDTFEGKESISRFMNDVHNDVNARLGKPVWSYEENRRLYSRAHSQKSQDVEPLVALVVIVVLLCLIMRKMRKKMRHRIKN